jgi:hypothetical protein
VLDEQERGIGEANAATGGFEERDPRLAFEHRELLGNRRGRVLQRVSDRGDRAAGVELGEQPEPAKFQH